MSETSVNIEEIQKEITGLKARSFDLEKEQEAIAKRLIYLLGQIEMHNRVVALMKREMNAVTKAQETQNSGQDIVLEQ